MRKQGWDTAYHQGLELQAKEQDYRTEEELFNAKTLEELQNELEALETAYNESPSVITDLQMAKYKKRIKDLK